ncbi:Nitroimidazol reductase NimA, pyridoxamine 5'-phosphate oxidase superfamily [Leifsonia sp. 98AMF]|uniref:pyridoxamine 5'-phosphate oxidase family protein n=1 Tax=unclassified Leifsonia TaxID=2663824 RepID=UPI000879849B|nr:MULTISPECIES: pyridoxamine 5'-phosphate oxidase family protein [unclassified Leifsonia]SDH63182.1 Nitroimidazol reductase NimA, pyridoxamine 5'-phosphate oxidase superfamily [Leifsonia sp. 197AMF]SDI76137.1 Nitroimidazol reductase NimA, pyridoxamine 5'-phosphate oxidase superfamily [Leifsonia sp. 466MF]SDK11248.1 Nitroimidazol reductase NimA, pyridoxamine 5'-phosphate oxidase superfamily [Leifsonia sp. 157MF]SDN79371.1 Nitroimidazol reductase NimA, pyridoxamine 5'-phosphate oxidase superfami
MSSDEPVQELDRAECRELLKQGVLGRLATAVGGEVDIFPVNYYSDGDSILIRTAPGTKLLELTVHSAVAFETDGYTDEEAWSVVAHGPARQLEHQAEIDEADRAPLQPWVPTLKYRYIHIDITALSGRRFRRSAEPERW